MMQSPVIDPILLFTAVVGCSVALVLFLIAWHGRRVDQHPICRRCRFDLFGLGPDAKRCPECGASLENPRDIQIGRREKRRWMLVGSVLIALGSLGGLTLVALPVARGIQWIRLKPTPWLMNDVKNGTPGDEATAIRELARRVGEGSLSSGSFDELIQVALDRQADQTTSWINSYGDVLEIALLTDRMTEDERTQFLRNAIQPTLMIVPGQENNDSQQTISLGYRAGSLRVGSNGLIALGATLESWRIDDGPLHEPEPNHAVVSIFGGSAPAVIAVMQNIGSERGEHEVHATWQFEFVPTAKRASNKALVTWETTLTGTVDFR